MSEKIISIEELNDSGYDGYVIKTSEQDVFLKIGSEQQCCEEYGYFFCNDDFSDFIGSDVLDITLTDTELNTEKFNEIALQQLGRGNSFEGALVFVNIETSKGTLQFVAYNEHNGYYGHQVIIESKQTSFCDYI